MMPRGADGWETSVASAGKSVVFTGNYFAAYSKDGGATFTPLSPFSMMSGVPLGFCCDQVVRYVPQVDTFFWILQSAHDPDKNGNENRYRLAYATPDQLRASDGKAWKSVDITPGLFGIKGDWFDYPDLQAGLHDLIVNFDVVGADNTIVLRLPYAKLLKGSLGSAVYARMHGSFMRVVGGSQRIYWARQNNDSQLRVYSWDEGDKTILARNVGIPTIPTLEFESRLPNGSDWLGPQTKLNTRIHDATRARNELFFAWTAGRRYLPEPFVSRTFAQPHIEIVRVDVNCLCFLREDYIGNGDYAFAWPSLDTDFQEDVAVTFGWGGNGIWSNDAVGFITGKRQFIATTSGAGSAGGHYVTVHTHFPVEGAAGYFSSECFSAANYNQLPLGVTNHPHYVLFGRRGATCTAAAPRPRRVPSVVTGPASAVGPSSASLSGTVNPQGNRTTYRFEYGTTTAYGRVAGSGFDPGGIVDIPLSVSVSGLDPSTTYHYRVAAESAVGAAAGVDRTFTTQAPGADLVISSLSTTSFTVTNTGTAAAGAFSVDVRDDGVRTGTFPFPGLGPGMSDSRALTCPGSTHTAEADPDGRVAEADETNNSRTASCIQ